MTPTHRPTFCVFSYYYKRLLTIHYEPKSSKWSNGITLALCCPPDDALNCTFKSFCIIAGEFRDEGTVQTQSVGRDETFDSHLFAIEKLSITRHCSIMQSYMPYDRLLLCQLCGTIAMPEICRKLHMHRNDTWERNRARCIRNRNDRAIGLG